jgi:hypothetical protein
MMMTGSIPVPQRVPGFAGLAIRLGRALEAWGERAAEPAALADLEQRRVELRERGRAEAARDQALHGMYGIR